MRATATLLLFTTLLTLVAAQRIDKSTYACSKSAATNAFAWEMKYLPVEEADDDCPNRSCQCGEQSRVALKVSSSVNGSVGVSPGFGIHCTYAGGENDSRAAANGGTTEEQVEQRMAAAIGDWSTYDSDPNVRAWASYSTGLWAISGLDWYVQSFKTDGVAHHLGSWQSGGSTYWSALVLIPGTPVVLELMGSCSVCGEAASRQMPPGYVGATPRAVQPVADTPEQGLMYATHISRSVSNLSSVEQYYSQVFNVQSVSSGSLGSGAQFADFQPAGTSVSIRYVTQADQTGDQTTEWLQQLLLDTAAKYQTSPSSCWPIWGDFHWSGGFSSSILSLVTAAGKLGYPYRSFAGSGVGPSNAYMVDPSGMWVQVNGDSTGLPTPGGFEGSYCYTFCSGS